MKQLLFIKNLMGLILALVIGLSATKLFAQEGAVELPTRDKIADKYKWNLDDIYKTVDAWEADFKYLDENSEKNSQFEGKLGNSAQELLACLKFEFASKDNLGICSIINHPFSVNRLCLKIRSGRMPIF